VVEAAGMSKPEPTAVLIVREGLARVADACGVILLALLAPQVMFSGQQSFATHALAVGMVGAAAAWLSRSGIRRVPIAMLVYVGVALLSTIVHEWPGVAAMAEPDWWLVVAPAWHLVVMAVFVAGSAHLLRSPRRLGVFVVFLAVAIAVIATQTLFDRISTNFVYAEGGSLSLPSVSQWGGMHQVGLVLVIGFPLFFAVSCSSTSRLRILAGAMLGAGLLLVAALNGSRSGIGTMVISALAMGGLSFSLGRQTRWAPQYYLLGLLVLGAGVWFGAAQIERSRAPLSSISSGRWEMWSGAAAIIYDHPLLGVGPGNYNATMIDGGYAERYLPHYSRRLLSPPDPAALIGTEQAHNMLLHVAAETGLAGALSLLVFWIGLMDGCWRSLARSHWPLLSMALLAALGAFLLRCMYDNFLDVVMAHDRVRVLAWMLFGAALALQRLVPAAPQEHQA
jgi:O-antigen ligase